MQESISRNFHVSAAYIHIPFCLSKCHYCDFNSLGIGQVEPPEREYVAALIEEFGRWRRVLREEARSGFDSVFFGGGTPSLFRPETLAEILLVLQELAPILSGAEKTLELNPKTADLKKMQGLVAAGFNRLSVGVQTLDETLLGALARAHGAEDALQALRWAFAAGFPQVNVDLMYGLPGQETGTLRSTCERLSEFPLRHLSAYELIVEEGTPFFARQRRGALALPQEDSVAAMKAEIEAFATAQGMKNYEISNYSAPRHESRHNLHYWNYDSFIGFGAGATSFLRKEELHEDFLRSVGLQDKPDLYGLRLTNPAALREYQDQSAGWKGVHVEPIFRNMAMGEFMMMGLRKRTGICFADFVERFSEPFPQNYREVLRRAEAKGWAVVGAEACRLTELGRTFSNSVLGEFL
ncbi:MAG TPA: hypothetical protein DF383_08015 [Deltaproteobacteria bacterium]|nr:hypothetical protein [Deltaproteobacteria bacterium]